MLRRFTVIFDYPHGQMILEPTSTSATILNKEKNAPNYQQLREAIRFGLPNLRFFN